jgi:hypothetical protein
VVAVVAAECPVGALRMGLVAAVPAAEVVARRPVGAPLPVGQAAVARQAAEVNHLEVVEVRPAAQHRVVVLQPAAQRPCARARQGSREARIGASVGTREGA